MGELLEAIEPRKNQHDAGTGTDTRTEVAKDTGMSKRHQVTAVRVSSKLHRDYSDDKSHTMHSKGPQYSPLFSIPTITTMPKERNPYNQPKGPRLRMSAAAFVDILGYESMIRKSSEAGDSESLLRDLHSALKESHEQIDPEKSDDVLRGLSDRDCSAFRSFTDNIVIGRPIVDDAEIELGMLFDELSYFQTIMALKGFFVRGGIAIGELFMDEVVVFGPALIDAYESEQRAARDPRIVLAPSALKAVERHLTYYGRGLHAPQVYYLLRDADGQYFLNYLSTLVAENGHFFADELKTHKARIEEKLVEFSGEPRILSKYLWVARYHNYFCQVTEVPTPEFEVDVEAYQVGPALIVE